MIARCVAKYRNWMGKVRERNSGARRGNRGQGSN
jgi:hypothetical protein